MARRSHKPEITCSNQATAIRFFENLSRSVAYQLPDKYFLTRMFAEESKSPKYVRACLNDNQFFDSYGERGEMGLKRIYEASR